MAVQIITRAQWGARPFARPREYVKIGSRRYFVNHYPGASTPPADIAAYCKWIERIHMDERGWAGLGYNFVISHGKVAEGCGRDVVGSHSPPHNRDGIGVNIWSSGGVPLPGDLQLARELYDQLSSEAGHQLIKWYHGKDYATECPGPQITAWVNAGMPYQTGGGSGPLPPGGEDDMTPEQMKQVLREFFAEGAPDQPAGSVRNTINETYRHTTGEYQRGIIDAVLWSPVVPDDGSEGYEDRTPALARSSWRNNMLHLGARTDAILNQLTAISSKLDVDVDEQALATLVVEAITPVITSAVTESVEAGGEPEAIAQATLDLVLSRINAPRAEG